MKLIEVVADPGDLHTMVKIIAENHGAEDYWFGHDTEKQRQSVRMLVADENRQVVMDRLQDLLAHNANARIIVLPVEAVLPRPEPAADAADSADKSGKKTVSATREELYNQIEKGTRCDTNFFILVVLSTVVAGIGLLENNVAVLVGAMVIAPLLGPNLALAFAATLGDRVLMRESLVTNFAGLGVALALSMAIGGLWPMAVPGQEVLARTDVGFGSVVLALASGAAAALSLTSGLASALVGVMVAVALLPPTAALGMTLASAHEELAAGAALLLAVNIVSVNLSATLVFVFRGVRPRTWIEKRRAQQSTTWIALFWAAALAILLLAVYLRDWVHE